MLSEKALYYYKNGYNCSQCILKAYSEIYNFKINKQVLNTSATINNGFGIGSICSVLVTAIIILAIKFEPFEAKQKRIILLDKFHKHYSDLNCSQIRKYGCENIIKDVCNILEEIT